ncbi:Npt1/Npt2 family nucleotide transporter [Paenibacillus sacheonensis]|uniref:ADP,ATP carrier protein n=1 Tax=Paenibacillus sacheonensis TaxID=742054 RepID=A0A7X4YR21_9BACL|nr:Npt1/Npt2 family nucleotide transporter [Paenibacillus sacheonensis]MBM7567108.1 CRP-like cAMP-binding protein/ATP/ADP translocase [Paenibacillus sacheonensis]NBC70963.1 cyclic nucleotide-binding domain-containing protein [Paenibacillus sacheonensis]
MKRISGKRLGAALGRISADGDEYRKVALLFAYLMFVVSASTVGRTAADALFLSHFDASALSKMYLPQAAALILTGLIFQRYSPRARIDRLILGLIPAITALVVLTRIGAGLGHNWTFPVIYVAYDVFNFLMIVCFWQFAPSVLDQRKVKRTIGLVGSGGITGGILSGFGLKLIVPIVGTTNLIFFYAGLQLLAAAAVILLVRMVDNPGETFSQTDKKAQASAASKSKKRQAKDTEKEGLFASVPHLKYVAIMSAALILALTFVDYQFKVILRGELQNEALAGFMGSFYGWAGLLALFVQVFIAGRLLTRFGVMAAILVFPVVLFAGSLGVLLVPMLATAVLVKGSDKVVGDTINASVNQLIMFPIPPKWRNRAKSFLDGIVRNGAKGVAAISLIALSPVLSAQQFSYLILALLVLCVAAAIKVKGAYLKTLLATLQTDGAKLDGSELDFMDPASRGLLEAALRSPDKQQVLYSLRILRDMEGFDLAPHLPHLLRHPAREVVVKILQHVERAKPAGLEPELSALARDSHGQARPQALLALTAYAREEYLDEITGYLEDSDLELKSCAIAGLIKYYGIEGMFLAVGALKPLLESTDEEERSAVAGLFGRIGIKAFYKPLIPLLQDASPRVLRLALRSAEALQVRELVPYIVPLLQHGDTRKNAIDALAAYDEKTIVPLLEPYFDGDHPVMHLPKVFERLATPAAFDMLLSRYAKSDFELRNKLLEALIRMQRSAGPPADKQVAVIERLAAAEMELYWQLSERMSGLGMAEAYHDAAEVAGQVQERTVWRIFQLLALVYDAATIQAVYANWSEGDARQQANAMEVMDQLTHGPIRMELARIMTSSGAAAVASRTEAQLAEQLAWLAAQGDEWLRQVIGFAMNPEGSDSLKDHMARIRMLRGFSLFQGLTSRELSALAEKLTPVEAKRGETVFRAEDDGNSLYLIRGGRIGIYRRGEKLSERGVGESFGQSGVLIRRVRSADAVAEADSSLWRLDAEDFYEVMFDRSVIAIEMMKLLSRRLRTAIAGQKKPENAAALGSAGEGAEDASQADAAAAAKEIAAAAQEAAAASTSDGDGADSLLRRVLILQKIDLFAHLSHEDIVRLAQMVDEVEYAPGEAVCKVGDYGDMLYGIIEGTVRVHRGGETLASLGEGDCFGEMAIIDSGPRSADCTATEHTVLLQLHRDQVFSLCFQNMDVLRSMLQVMGNRLKGMIG